MLWIVQAVVIRQLVRQVDTTRLAKFGAALSEESVITADALSPGPETASNVASDVVRLTYRDTAISAIPHDCLSRATSGSSWRLDSARCAGHGFALQ